MSRRIAILFLIPLLLLGPGPGLAQAKGPSQRVVITGPGIGGQLVLDDLVLIEPLGMTAFEDCNTKASRGTILYLGLVNGSTEYDGKWFPVTPTGHRPSERPWRKPIQSPAIGVRSLGAGSRSLNPVC